MPRDGDPRTRRATDADAALQVTARSLKGARVIAIAGEVDVSSVGDVQAHIDAAFADGHALLAIDLTQVTFLDSAVLHALFRTLHRARGVGGDLAVVCVDPSIRRLLEVFGLSNEVEVCDDVQQAVAALIQRRR
jgi:anti-sigma B factor antagonist